MGLVSACKLGLFCHGENGDEQFPMVLLVIDTEGDWVESPRVSALVEPLKCASSVRDNTSNLAELLMFPHLCTTYPVTSKKPKTKHQSEWVYPRCFSQIACVPCLLFIYSICLCITFSFMVQCHKTSLKILLFLFKPNRQSPSFFLVIKPLLVSCWCSCASIQTCSWTQILGSWYKSNLSCFHM